ncbi:YceD family protein [Orenia marismortui]|uniref:YceD family protein n=1 Tax=Orenia marismortui TaxID=46469 RepID=UPI00036F3FAF|nr:DUF177 domain-containing protein [Orenia marismortui]
MNAKVNIESIKEDLGTQLTAQLDISLDEMSIHGRQISFDNPAKLDLTVINSNDQYIITGKVELLVELPCSRCLEDFSMPLEFDFDFQVDKSAVDNDHIDLSQEILDGIRLHLPMKAACREDCKGLCPSCGINLNEEECDCIMHKVDPRLAKLSKLLDKKSK